MKQRIAIGLVAGLLLAAAPAAADVIVRVEGPDSTLLKTTVPRTGAPVTRTSVRNGQTVSKTCDGDSAIGALDRAVSSDFGADAYSFGLLVTRIRTLSLDGNDRFWGFEYRNSFANVGACDVKPADGQEVLFYAGCGAATTGCFDGQPLDVTGPATATVGEPFTVSVVEFDDSQDPAPSSPAAFATVSGGGQSSVTASAGKATFQFDQPGPVTLVATKGRQIRDSLTVDVRPAPVYGVPTAEPTAGPGGVTPPADTVAPVTTIKAPKGRFKKGKGPRRLRVAVAETGGVDSVSFALTRKNGKACSTFDADTERFKGAKCGARRLFTVPAGGSVSFLLPNRLPKGKYTFVALATDLAGNAERVVRGRNRVVFRVS